ncbi:helix-turn-helix domain-containing protein [Trichormus azollae]|uniref:helix-turn-helix domain-containing protein n=1 Tax=Trichormus azollae TaxID=1164 RepID=UPI00325D766F
MTPQDMRKARKLTQESMAELLGIRQDSVSRLEKRAEVLLSTLRSYLEAMGGEVKLVPEFPDRLALIISSLGELEK